MFVVEALITISFWGPIVLFIIGVPGAIFNIIFFTTIKTFRQSPSTYYIVGQSLFDFGTLLTVLLQSIPSTTISTSSLACKLMIFFSQVTSVCALTFLFLAAFDRWACTSRKVKIRQLSSVRVARLIFPIPLIFWSLVNLPYLLYSDLTPPFNVCAFTNALFAQVAFYFLAPILCVICPLIILIVFGILTYRNFHMLTNVNIPQFVQTRLSQWEQQVTRMMIIQIVLNVLCTLPRSGFLIYTVATVDTRAMRSLDQVYLESFIDQITLFLICLAFASSFYIFLLTSLRFRQSIKSYVRQCLHLPNNQITFTNATLSRPTVIFQKLYEKEK